jgi:tetratricopeptide (TPR) repeat protein/DNA-binding CsgD family transcriptional regulator
MNDTYDKLFEPPKQFKEISNVKLTNRELDILACLMYRRVSDPAIAELLTINKRTVETHIRNITQKLNCSTRTIRKLVEEKIGSTDLANHYQNLLYELGFKHLTNKINAIARFKQKSLCDVVIYTETSFQAKLSNILPYLQMCGINAIIASTDTFNAETLKTNSTTDVFLSSEKPSFNNFNDKMWVEYSSHKNPYQIILDIVAFVLPNPDIKALIDMFLRAAPATNILNGNSNSNIDVASENTIGNPLKASFVSNRKNLLMLFTSITFLIIGVSFATYFISSSPIHGQKRAEVLLPPAHAILKRDELVRQLKHLLYKKSTIIDSEIPTVIISGIGGAGKTTLSRLVAQQHKGVIWEFNASSEENLKASFKDLAYTFIDSNEDRAQLNFINTLGSAKEQDKQIYSFVRNKLRQNPDWLLIFDDVKTSDIVKTYCPKDASVWGKGGVIITTRDSTLTGHQSYNIQLEELSQEDCLKLFNKVRFPNSTPDKDENVDIYALTKSIPAFPLDIVIAASYMSNSSTKGYTEYSKGSSSKQDELYQKEILSTHDDYNNTRHEIIAVSLDTILKDQSFLNLLFIISLLDPQNIPKGLLLKYSEPRLIDRFIKELKKYSIITSETTLKNRPVFSLHASIQSSIRDYLKSHCNPHDYDEALYRAVLSIERYLNGLVETLAYDEAQAMLMHIDIARNQANLPAGILGILNLGYANLLTTRPAMPSNVVVPMLEKALEDITYNLPQSLTDPLREARCLSILGDRYRALSMYDKSQNALEKSIETYESLTPTSLEAARAYVRMGILLRMTGKLEIAKTSFIKALDIYKHYLSDYMPKETLFSIAFNERDRGNYKSAVEYLQQDLDSVKDKNDPWFFWIKDYMAGLYYSMGCYKKSLEYYEATEMFKYESNSTEPTLAYATKLAYVGAIYAMQGDIKKAMTCLEQSSDAFIRIAGKNNLHVTYYTIVLPYIAYCHILKKEYEKAKSLLEFSLNELLARYKDDLLYPLKIRTYLGVIAMKEGSFNEAEERLRQAIDSVISINHPNIFFPMEILSDTLYEKSKITQPSDAVLAKEYKDQAKDLLSKAIHIVEERISPQSDHLHRLRKKLRRF